MNHWSTRTLELVNNQNYLDQLQIIYAHDEGEREEIDHEVIALITKHFHDKNEEALLNELLSLEKFPYKDSYVAFLRKDRLAIGRNPETTHRICGRLYNMGIDNVIAGVKQAKEANQRRGPQFTNWLRTNFDILGLQDFKSSKTGIFALGGNEKDAMDFCNKELGIAVSKRPDLVAKVGTKYVVGEAKFLSSTGGNQKQGFEDGMKLASSSFGTAQKVFVLDGIHWIEKGSEAYKRIEASTANIFSILLLKEFLNSIEVK